MLIVSKQMTTNISFIINTSLIVIIPYKVMNGLFTTIYGIIARSLTANFSPMRYNISCISNTLLPE